MDSIKMNECALSTPLSRKRNEASDESPTTTIAELQCEWCHNVEMFSEERQAKRRRVLKKQPRQTRSTTRKTAGRSALEKLPTELLDMIFFTALNLNLPLASRTLLQTLSDPSIFQRLGVLAFRNGSKGDPRLQTAVMRRRFFNAPYWNAMRTHLGIHYDKRLSFHKDTLLPDRMFCFPWLDNASIVRELCNMGARVDRHGNAPEFARKGILHAINTASSSAVAALTNPTIRPTLKLYPSDMVKALDMVVESEACSLHFREGQEVVQELILYANVSWTNMDWRTEELWLYAEKCRSSCDKDDSFLGARMLNWLTFGSQLQKGMNTISCYDRTPTRYPLLFVGYSNKYI